jgi:outer membrane receptor protein involved in Fe transport
MNIPGFFDISNGTGTPITSIDESKKRTYGFFGDATLGFSDYLFLNIAGRYDFTSTLPEDDNNYFYPNFGLSFVLSEALEGMRDTDTYMRFTLSNSTTYNDLGPYQINETFSQAEGFPYGPLNGFEQSPVAVDPNISKEKINTTEFGANLSFFKNRLTFDAAYFFTESTDLITNISPSFSSGSSSILTNIGKVEGTGLELTLGGRILQSQDWGWDLSVNYTSYESIVKEISEGVDEIAMYINDLEYYSTGEVGFYAIVDEAFPQIKATSYQRDSLNRVIVDSETGVPLKGDPKKFGKTTPDFILGMTTSLRWKTLSFTTTMDYRTGHVYYDIGDDANFWTGRSPTTVEYDREDYVFPNSVIETSPGVFVENTDVEIDDSFFYWIEQYGQIRENFIKDATSFKVREMALNYEIPHKYLDHTSIHRLQIGIIARNYISYFPGENTFSDPEFQNQTVNENAIGIGGYYQPPPTKSLGFNINIEF